MKIGYTCGVFDILHEGHINLLKNAKTLCDKLIVGLTIDEKILYKNKNSILKYDQRKSVLESIKYVDTVIPQEDHNKYNIWKKIKYDVLIVGDDWYNTKEWESYENLLNKENVKVIYFPYTKHISTTLIKKSLINLHNIFIIFDLDKTLWDFYTNLLSENDFNEKLKNFEFTDDIVRIFTYLHNNNIKFGFASRSKYKERCSKLLEKLNINLDEYYHCILWTEKKTKLPHINNLIKDTKISPEFFILFDDDIENINSVTNKIYHGELIKNGLKWENFINALYII